MYPGQKGKPAEHEVHEPGAPIPTRWKTWFKDDKKKRSSWAREATEAFNFLAGRQWPETDKQLLKDQLRPAITFDRSSVIIDAISGNEIQNRQIVQYLPREEGDAVANELYTEAARWFDQESDAEDEDSDAFVDATMAGVGVTESRLDNDADPEGAPMVDRINPLEMYPDASSVKQNFKDARRHHRLRTFTRDEVLERWPDIDPKDVDATLWTSGSKETGEFADTHSNDPVDRYNQDDNEDDDEGGYVENTDDDIFVRRYRVVHLQYWCYEYFYKVDDPLSGKIVDIEEEKYKSLAKNMQAAGMQVPKGVRLRRRKFYQAFLGRVVLEHTEAPCPKEFSWQFITGKRDRARGTWYGLYRALRDPQEWANKWLSQVLHIMNSNSKGGLLYETGAFADQADAEEKWSNPSGMVELNPGALTANKVKERAMAQFPQGYQILTEFAVHAVRETTGINLEFLGGREVNQPGVLEYQRKQAGLTVLAPLFNSLRRYRKGRGRLLLWFITEDLSDGRLIRITGQDKAQYVPLLKQADVQYDVIVDDAPTSPNQKEIVWQSFIAILPGIKDIVPPDVMLSLLEYSPIPSTVVQKIKKIVEAKGPQQAEQAKIEARAMLAEIVQTENDAQLKKAQATKTMAEIGMDETGAPLPAPDPTEHALNMANVEDKKASARLKDAQRIKTIVDSQRPAPATGQSPAEEQDKLASARLKEAQRLKALGEIGKLPAEEDLIVAQAEAARKPKPAPRAAH